MKIIPLAMLVALFCNLPTPTRAQMAKDLVGTWALESITHEQNGSRTDYYGPNPKGLLMFDAEGHFSVVILRSDLPKFSSDRRTTGTPEEDKAVVQGSLAFFGTYEVEEAAQAFVWHVEGCTFPNWTGTNQRRPFTVSGDELEYVTAVTSGGTGTYLSAWKRVSTAGPGGGTSPPSAKSSPPVSDQPKPVVAR